MRKLIFIIILITIVPTYLFSQNKEMKKLFMEYENVSGFDLSIGTSDADFDFDFDSGFFELLNNIKDIYILNYKGNINNAKYMKFKNKFDKIMSKSNYSPIIDISSDGVFKILIQKDSNDKASSIVMINENDESAMYLVAVN